MQMPVTSSLVVLFSAAFFTGAGTWLFVRYLLKGNAVKGYSGKLPEYLNAQLLVLPQKIDFAKLVNDRLGGDANAAHIRQLLQPEVETQINRFIAERMEAAFPMIFQLMGQKTLQKFKQVFVDEVVSLLPGLLHTYTLKFATAAPAKQILMEAVKLGNETEIVNRICNRVQPLLYKAIWLASIAGAYIGLLQIFVLWLAGLSS